MASWDKITVEQYQLIHSVVHQDLDDVDKSIRIIGVVYNLTEDQISKLPYDLFLKRVDEVVKLFSIPKQGRAKRSIVANGKRYAFDYNIGKQRFAQYMESQHFLKSGLVENLHLIMASIARPVTFRIFKGKNKSEDHEQVAADLQKANFLELYHSAVFFCSVLSEWNSNWQGLFEIQENEDDEPFKNSSTFSDRYGWIYSATKIRDHEMKPLEWVYEMSVMNAFNDLAYLKALRAEENYLNKKARGNANNG